MDRISVIVPIYNLVAYLYQCVDSIVRQSYSNLEIILVDDGSTDAALEICEYFRKSDPRIRVIAKPNGGLVSARKAGLAQASGDYVFYVDGDDWIDPDCLQSMHELARRHEADVIAAGHMREFLGNFSSSRNLLPQGLYRGPRLREELLPQMISMGSYFQHGIKTYSWGKLYRRALISELQQRVPDEIALGEDAALVYPALLAARSVYVSDLTLYNYRHRPNSILQSTRAAPGDAPRIARAFSYMADALGAREDREHGFMEQLRAYFSALLIIRNGAFLGDAERYAQHALFGEIASGTKVALYNSGSFGQHVHQQLREGGFVRLVGWLDRDFRESCLLRMPVRDPATLHELDFDLLLVASLDPAVFDEAAQQLARQGLPLERIRRIAPPAQGIPRFIESLGFDPTSFAPRGLAQTTL